MSTKNIKVFIIVAGFLQSVQYGPEVEFNTLLTQALDGVYERRPQKEFQFLLEMSGDTLSIQLPEGATVIEAQAAIWKIYGKSGTVMIAGHARPAREVLDPSVEYSFVAHNSKLISLLQNEIPPEITAEDKDLFIGVLQDLHECTPVKISAPDAFFAVQVGHVVLLTFAESAFQPQFILNIIGTDKRIFFSNGSTVSNIYDELNKLGFVLRSLYDPGY